jgi:hypothetical protein
MKRLAVAIAVLLCAVRMAWPETWAEKLGWQKGDRVLIIHSDDVGMCHSTNLGAIAALEKGVVSSISIMMPCPWVGEIADYLKTHPEVDAGLHLALTSEWDYYRWAPVAGKCAVPGLADAQGCLWDNVALVQQHASPDEIETEIRAQIDRAIAFGIKPTHLDSHMGTLFSSPAYFQRFLKVAVDKQIPLLMIDLSPEKIAEEAPTLAPLLKAAVKAVWDAGFPMLDDIITDTYDWPADQKKANYIKTLRELKPGLTEMIVHCAKRTEDFISITPAADRWIADGECMLDPEIKKVLEDEKIILTTWRELKARRDGVGSGRGK